MRKILLLIVPFIVITLLISINFVKADLGVYNLSYVAGENGALSSTSSPLSFNDEATMTDVTAYAGHDVINDEIYVSGGLVGDWIDSDSLSIYNPANDSWNNDLPLMSMTRGTPLSVNFDNKLYVIGGWDSTWTATSSVEFYDPATTTPSWSMAASMNVARNSSFGGVYQGEIYVFGGEDAYWRNVVSSVEIYNLASNTWRFAEQEIGRVEASAEIIGDTIYVMGGRDENNYYDTVFSLDLSNPSSTWHTLASLPEARFEGGTVHYNGYIYYFGGMNSDYEATDSIFVYDILNNKWSRLGNLPVHLSEPMVNIVNGVVYISGGLDFNYDFLNTNYSISIEDLENNIQKDEITLTVNEGYDAEAIYAIPDYGYRFLNWSDGNTSNPRQDLNVTGDINVTANFEVAPTYTAIYSAGTGGTITGSSTQVIFEGEDFSSVEAVSSFGYRFLNWSDGETSNPRQDLNATGDINITANFEEGGILIYTCHDLQNMTSLNYYELANDIDCSMLNPESSNFDSDGYWSDGKGFKPIGTGSYPFEGVLNGKGYTINDFYINRPLEDYVALFAFVGDRNLDSGFKNINFGNPELETGGVNITGNEFVATLVAKSFTEIYFDNINVYGNLESRGDVFLGGLGGWCVASINNSSFVGTINSSSEYVGGLIGANLAGFYNYQISNSFVEADITSSASSGFIGGLSGQYNGSVDNSSFTGTINSSGSYVAGLIGANFSNSFHYQISNSFVEADIISSASSGFIGGLSGQYNGSVDNSSFTGTINSSGSYVAGLIGANFSNSFHYQISNSFVEADIISSPTSDFIGGIIGRGSQSLTTLNSYFIGDIENARNYVGGIVGSDGIVYNSFSKGSISGLGILGGISGIIGYVYDSYSLMNITVSGSGANDFVGGIVASLNGGIVSNSYFAGTFIDISENGNNLIYGISNNFGSPPVNSYWNINSGAISGTPTGFGEDEVHGVLLEDFKSLNTFTDWSIAPILDHSEETWYINEGYDYPRLFWEDKEFYLEYNSSDNGTITGSSTQKVVAGESGSLIQAIPNTGYQFTSWSDGNSSASRVDTNVSSNILVTANFKKIPSSGASNAVAEACRNVEYGPWQDVKDGFSLQFRGVISLSPSGCYLSEEQRKGMERVVIQETSSEEIIQENNNEQIGVNIREVMKREREMFKKLNKELSEKLSGRILLQVEEKGEAWYLEPISKAKHFMGRPHDAFNMMRKFGLGISEADFAKFEKSGVPARFSGRILLRAQANGEAYYVNPVDMKMYYLGRPADAFKIMRELALGISNENLRQIKVAE